MTDTAHSADSGPVVALFCTRGMETFLSNALQGILQAGIDAGRIYVGCPNNTLKSVRDVARLHSIQIQVISNQKLSERQSEMEKYRSFGSREFTEISWKKIFFIRQLLEHRGHVVYADLDVSWIRNPLPYLTEVALVYPMAFQTEGLPRFPPAFCSGFVSFARSKRAIAFLDALIEFHTGQLGSETRLDDQAVLQRLIENDLTWLHDIYCLPEALFLNGLGYRNLQDTGESPCQMEGELLPFLFHANWTVGIDNKRKLLANTGTWFLGDSPQIDQTEIRCSSSTELASDIQARAEPRLLLTVVYPVIDVRGELVERIGLWTKQQDLDARGYRIFVVAGTETELNEVALRKVLRNQDALLRIPGAGCDADYWNAGAREANTPWLLFVEAHGLPEPDSLSALAAWIAANPNEMAGNFSIKNLGGGRIGELMKRWFAEIQDSWAAPSTWPRFHRTAFAIRRDLFGEVGPFEPSYGNFAPPLLSARLHQRDLPISSIPASRVNHELSPDMATHHEDTADYVRGEMTARAESDPVFFEKYFGAPPSHGYRMIPARYSRSMLRSLVVAALYRRGEASDLLKRACALLPMALVSLRDRARLLAAVTRVDEWLVMRLPLTEKLRWKRFLLAHHRVVRAAQMLWIAGNPLPSLRVGPGNERWPVSTTGQHAIFGLHALEHSGEDVFRWTFPVFMLRLAPTVRGVLTFETRNVRREIGLSDITVVVGGRMLPPQDLALDDAGNVAINIEAKSTPSGEIDVVVIVRELCEPASENGRGRRLGLPLFSVGFECEDPHKSRAATSTRLY
jgi:hypothetical protein